MDFMQQLKLRQLFGLDDPYDPNQPPIGTRVPKTTFQQPIITASPLNPPEDATTPLMRPRRTPALDAYKTHLQSEPIRQDYQMGKIGSILAAGAALMEGKQRGVGAGLAMNEAITSRPYNRAMGEYGAKTERLKDLASLEYQSLSDQEKRDLAVMDYSIKDRKQKLDEFEASIKGLKDMADIDLANKRGANIGISLKLNDADGHLYRIDQNTGESKDLGKFGVSEAEKTAKEKELFSFKYNKEQQGRVSLESMREAHDKNLEGIRTANDKKLAEYRSVLSRGDKEFERQLEGMTPAAQKAAYELAYTQTEDELGADVSDDNPVKFMDAVRGRLQNIRKMAGQPQMQNAPLAMPPNAALPPESAPPTIIPPTAPQSAMPQVQDPRAMQLRQAAMAAITNEYPNNPELLQNEAAIQSAMQQIATASSAMTTPQVQSPIGVNTQGMFGNVGQPTNPTPTVSPGHDFTTFIEWLKRQPNNVYGNMPGTMDSNRLR